MKFFPDPLHPAIVHFPIVLILMGTVAAMVAVFWRKHSLPLIAAVLLSLGALGSWVAIETGESDGGLVENSSPPAQSMLDSHEDWAKRTLTVASLSAVAAVVSVALRSLPRAARGVAAVAAIAALGASYAVYETGHRGGALVFKHGVGVAVVSAQPSPVARAAEDH